MEKEKIMNDEMDIDIELETKKKNKKKKIIIVVISVIVSLILSFMAIVGLWFAMVVLTYDDNMMNGKPVIYLYPETETDVSVNLTLDGELTCTYPKYNNGWTVTASPDGTLTDSAGQTYNYLYWEGTTNVKYDLSKGFCIKGKDTAAFLEDALAKLGLNRREANEFIVYWLPLMEQNEYNIISFQTDIYTDAAQLEINPTPDTLIRVLMAWQKSDEYVDIPEQNLTTPERSGFTVVEWGGSEIID